MKNALTASCVASDYDNQLLWFFDNQEMDYYDAGMNFLQHHWQKFVELERTYVVKLQVGTMQGLGLTNHQNFKTLNVRTNSFEFLNNEFCTELTFFLFSYCWSNSTLS